MRHFAKIRTKKKYSKLEIAMIRNSNKCHNTLSSCFIKCENSNLRAGLHQVPLLDASSFSRRTGSVKRDALSSFQKCYLSQLKPSQVK